MTDKSLSRQMWQIALPAIVTNISIPLLGLVDAFIMGHLPDPRYLGAIALGAMLISLLYNSVNFLRMATTGFTAQAQGRNEDTSKIFLRASLLAVVIGLIFILIQQPVADITFLMTGADQGVKKLARQYFLIRIWGAPFAMMNFVASGWLLGIHRAREALWIQLVLNISNILLDFLFVYGLGMDVDGVALGTILAEGLAAGVAGYLVNRHTRLFHHLWRGEIPGGLFRRAEFIKLFALNRDIFIRTASLTGSMAAFTILGATMGTAVLAANAILMNLQMVTSYGLDGFAQAAEVMVGKQVGRKSLGGLHRAVLVSGKWAVITAFLFSLGYFLFGDMLVNALTNIPMVRTTARHYMIWVIVLPLVSIWAFQLDGIFIGATAGGYMRNAMLVSVLVYAGSLMIFMPLWHNHGLWLSYVIFMIVRALCLSHYYPEISSRFQN